MTAFERVVVVAPPGVDASPLAAAVRRHHPEVDLTVVDGEVTTGPPEPLGVGWQRLALALDGHRWALARGVAGATARLRAGETVVVLVAGGVAVTGPLHALAGASDPLVLVGRTGAPIPHDGLAPAVSDLVPAGSTSTSVLLARPGAAEALDDVLRLLCVEPALTAGQVLDLTVRRAEVGVLDDPSTGVGWWRAPAGPIALLDVEGLDPSRPWVLAAADPRPGRVRLSEHPALGATLRDALDQVPPADQGIKLPGGVEIDPPLRAVVAADLAAHLDAGEPCCPEPFTDTVAFLAWATTGTTGPGRYWEAVLAERPDLRAAFPEVEVGRYRRFNRWANDRWRGEGRSLLLRAGDYDGYEDRAPGGVNVVGYLDRASGLGEAARSLADALEAAGLPVRRIAIGGIPSPLLDTDSVPTLDQALTYDTNLVVVTAEQLPALPLQLGADAGTGRRTIGYWFWELSEPSEQAFRSAAAVDEVWTATTFVRDAFAGRIDAPVHLAPLPRPTPEPSGRTRADFGLPADRFVVLCSFDLLSVAERKNPEGTIAAFTRAFAPDEGPLLVIKTINGDQRWAESERMRLAVGDRSDIVLWDANLDRDDHLALVREADCLVSLHRSEGLGLHLLEAMALGTPVVTTDYSGPTDFLVPGSAELIPYRLVPVSNAGGAYAETATWAEPDLDAAAAALRRVADDPAHRDALAAAGRRVVGQLPDRVRAGHVLRSLLCP